MNNPVRIGLNSIIGLIIITSICDTLNQLFLKTSIDSLNNTSLGSIRKILVFIFKLISLPGVWIGFIFSVFSLCIWLFVLSKADLNFAFSVDSMHYIFIGLASQFILKEKLKAKRWLGIIFIVVGIVMISVSK